MEERAWNVVIGSLEQREEPEEVARRIAGVEEPKTGMAARRRG